MTSIHLLVKKPWKRGFGYHLILSRGFQNSFLIFYWLPPKSYTDLSTLGFAASRPSSPPSHPCHSLTHPVEVYDLAGGLISKIAQTYKDTSPIAHTHTHSSSSWLCSDSGSWHWDWWGWISFGVDSTRSAADPPSASSCSARFRSRFSFSLSLCVTLSQALILCLTSLSVNNACQSAWQREHTVNPQSVNTLTVKTVVSRALNKKKKKKVIAI